jgi:spore coat polysaccharide biosynthesis predicted glycosyltransferase SpsG
VIDDMAHLDYYYADVVLNQNINADRLRYTCESTTRLLLGTCYALLRSEFLAWRGWQRQIPKVAGKILVTLGGGDPDNQTLKIVRALKQVDVDGLETVVVVGASNPHFQGLQSATRNSQSAIRLVRNVTNMSDLMVWADVAVSAGGSTCWEMAFMGLPNVLLVLAENQRGIAEGLAEAGVSLNLGWFKQVMDEHVAEALYGLLGDHNLRQQMSRNGREIVDGVGGERVVSALRVQM